MLVNQHNRSRILQAWYTYRQLQEMKLTPEEETYIKEMTQPPPHLLEVKIELGLSAQEALAEFNACCLNYWRENAGHHPDVVVVNKFPHQEFVLQSCLTAQLAARSGQKFDVQFT